MKHLVRTVVLFAVLASLVLLTGCEQATSKPDDTVPDVKYAMRWWNVLTPDEMVAALYGDNATDAQAMAAKNPYADLDTTTKAKVNAAAQDIGGSGTYQSVGEWWETLDCREMRIAAGDGNTKDPMSAYCAHYPGSGATKILKADEKAHVDEVGMALLGRDDPGTYPPDLDYAMRWWNELNPEEMVAALYGDNATAEQATAAKKMYADLDPETKKKVNDAAKEIYGEGGHDSVGEWWETLDCRKMRIAAGDGNTPDPMSAYCAHYPGSGHPKLLSDDALAHVNKVGKALLDRDDPGTYPPDLDYAMRWWNELNPEEMVATLYGDNATAEQATAAKKMYADLDPETKKKVNDAAKEIYGEGGHDSVGEWWETLNCTKMRIAAGDGNTHDPMSAYCAHYPGSGATPILGDEQKAHVDQVGMALLGRDTPGEYPPAS